MNIVNKFNVTNVPTECPEYAYSQRDFLVYSNLFFLAPVIWLLVKGPKKYVCEWVILTLCGINSMFYHLCDDGIQCSKNCIYPWNVSHALDFSLSYQLIPTMVFYLVEFNFSWYKVLIHLIIYIINLIFVLEFKPTHGDHSYFITVGVLAIAACVAHILYLAYKKQLRHEYTDHFDCIDAGVSAVLAIVALGFKFADGHTYWINHSLWHIFIFLSAWQCFEIYNIETSCFIFKRNKTCTQCERHPMEELSRIESAC